MASRASAGEILRTVVRPPGGEAQTGPRSGAATTSSGMIGPLGLAVAESTRKPAYRPFPHSLAVAASDGSGPQRTEPVPASVGWKGAPRPQPCRHRRGGGDWQHRQPRVLPRFVLGSPLWSHRRGHVLAATEEGLTARTGAAPPAARLATEPSYGMGLPGAAGTVALYAGMELADSGARPALLGGRLPSPPASL